ncbi:hypothetical protein B296_00031745 [Ensete ventricosum]|uniref:Mediator of RNA polymerase II transcription subunit 13 n=1 Tax=Ensete ventricosum TaxID=4639 RepID=A0A427AFI3_ENSVE|nr:hypothetical protein B296_00031745 [Ensete ventricosum]
MLLSLRNKVSTGLRNAMSDLVQSDSSVKSDIMTVKHELRKKDSIPVRLAGDIDGGMQDGTFTTPVGVWRSVGAPKATKPTRVCENLPSMLLNNLSDEGINFHGQRQPLQDLLDAIAFLVQQSTSFVDFSLDTNDGYGAYHWLGIQEQRRREFACGPYQDDWLKTSVNSLRLWEKAPLEPYASPKPVTYYALCPDIELLTSAAVDFFQQLGTGCFIGYDCTQPALTELRRP